MTKLELTAEVERLSAALLRARHAAYFQSDAGNRCDGMPDIYFAIGKVQAITSLALNLPIVSGFVLTEEDC